MDIFIILGINPRVWCMLGQHFTAELHPGPLDDLTMMSLLLIHCGNAHGAEGVFDLAFCCCCVNMHGSPATACWRSEDNFQESEEVRTIFRGWFSSSMVWVPGTAQVANLEQRPWPTEPPYQPINLPSPHSCKTFIPKCSEDHNLRVPPGCFCLVQNEVPPGSSLPNITMVGLTGPVDKMTTGVCTHGQKQMNEAMPQV